MVNCHSPMWGSARNPLDQVSPLMYLSRELVAAEQLPVGGAGEASRHRSTAEASRHPGPGEANDHKHDLLLRVDGNDSAGSTSPGSGGRGISAIIRIASLNAAEANPPTHRKEVVDGTQASGP